MSNDAISVLLFFFPVLVYLGFRFSHVYTWLVSHSPEVTHDFLTCPLCVTTHMAWTYAGLCLWFSYPAPTTVFGFIGYVLAQALVSYVLVHVIEALRAITTYFEVRTSEILQAQADTETESVTEPTMDPTPSPRDGSESRLEQWRRL